MKIEFEKNKWPKMGITLSCFYGSTWSKKLSIFIKLCRLMLKEDNKKM